MNWGSVVPRTSGFQTEFKCRRIQIEYRAAPSGHHGFRPDIHNLTTNIVVILRLDMIFAAKS